MWHSLTVMWVGLQWMIVIFPDQSYSLTFFVYEPVHEIFNNVVCATSNGSACVYAQSYESLCWSLEYSRIVKLLTDHHSECLSLKGGCRGSSEPAHVKMPHCWKSRALAHTVSYWYQSLSVCIHETHIEQTSQF